MQCRSQQASQGLKYVVQLRNFLHICKHYKHPATHCSSCLHACMRCYQRHLSAPHLLYMYHHTPLTRVSCLNPLLQSVSHVLCTPDATSSLIGAPAPPTRTCATATACCMFPPHMHIAHPLSQCLVFQCSPLLNHDPPLRPAAHPAHALHAGPTPSLMRGPAPPVCTRAQ